jgi:hypothetical protein
MVGSQNKWGENTLGKSFGSGGGQKWRLPAAATIGREREMKEKGKKKEKAKMGRPNQYRDKGVSFSDISFGVTRAPASVDMTALGPAGSLRHHYP